MISVWSGGWEEGGRAAKALTWHQRRAALRSCQRDLLPEEAGTFVGRWALFVCFRNNGADHHVSRAPEHWCGMCPFLNWILVIYYGRWSVSEPEGPLETTMSQLLAVYNKLFRGHACGVVLSME